MTQRRTFIKQIGAGALGYSVLATLPFCTNSNQEQVLPFSLPRSTPEEQGIASEAIHTFLDKIKESGIQFHSIMIVRHGHVVAEGWWAPYQENYIHQLYSLSKSFTSTAVGFAVSEGLFNIEDPVISFFPDEVPAEVSPNLQTLKVKHLLTMSVGQAEEPLQAMRDNTEDSWVKTFLAWPIEFEPGSRFLYNTAATFMLSAIVQKTSGEKVIDFLQPRLFEPLNIEHKDWTENPQDIDVGGYGFRVKTEDIAKLGLLYLQKGKWEGKQLIPAEWVATATSKQIQSSGADGPGNSDWDQGYGYQFWRNTVGGFRADGAYGQFSLVIPEFDTVVAITEQSMDMQASMKLVWEYLLPTMQNDTDLASNSSGLEALKNELKSLAILPPKFQANSALSSSLDGKVFQLPANEYNVQTIQFNFTNNECHLTIGEKAGAVKISCGNNLWITEGNQKERGNSLFAIPVRTDSPSKIAATAGWQDEQTLIINLQYIELCHGDSFTFVFDDDKFTLSFMNSISKENPDDPDPRPSLTGNLVQV